MAEQEEEWAARRAGCIKLDTRRQAEIVNASICSRQGDLSSGQSCWHDPLSPLAELLRLMEQAAAAFQAARRQQTPKMLAGAVGANGLDGTREVQAA